MPVGDFHGHGVPDLVTGFSFLHGVGDGSFGAPVDVGAPWAAAQLAAIDLDADERLDLAVPRPFPNDPAITLGDLDGDRKSDPAIGTGSSVAIPRGDGGGGFGAAALDPAAGGIATLTIGDFDADGTADVAATSSGAWPGFGGRPFGGSDSEACIGRTGVSVLLNRLRRVCDGRCPDDPGPRQGTRSSP